MQELGGSSGGWEDLYRSIPAFFFNTAVDADDGNEFLKSEVQKAIVNWIKLIENILTEGVANNEFNNIDTYKLSVENAKHANIILSSHKKEYLDKIIHYFDNQIKKI